MWREKILQADNLDSRCCFETGDKSFCSVFGCSVGSFEVMAHSGFKLRSP